jgi:formylglycine-generating enzyme
MSGSRRGLRNGSRLHMGDQQYLGRLSPCAYFTQKLHVARRSIAFEFQPTGSGKYYAGFMSATGKVAANQTTAIQPKLVIIPAGWFLMGSEDGQENERPIHRVYVDGFSLGAYQVTNAEFAHFLDTTGMQAPPFWSNPDFNRPEQPVVAVSWYEATKYCAWLSECTSRAYRLPTEAEWERAARGGLESKLFPWGDDSPDSLPDYNLRWKTGPESVGNLASNGFGLYDICANVHEWCSDWYQPDFYLHSPQRNPRGPDRGERKASRGGSWRHHVKVARCAARSSIPPGFQYADYGFRVACDAS